MAGVTLKVNGKEYSLPVVNGVTLQFALRDDLGLTGTKFGCGIAECGCCTVLLDGQPVRSCVTQLSDAIGKEVTTIEGLAKGDVLHPLQQAWIDLQVPQCGYCQSGQILSAVALLKQKPNPSDADISTITNICRCGTYVRVRRAIHRAAGKV